MHRTWLLTFLLVATGLVVTSCKNDSLAPVNDESPAQTKATGGGVVTPQPVIAFTETYLKGSRSSSASYKSVTVMDADGGNVTRLYTSAGVGLYSPAWSPDGTMIAFCEAQVNSAGTLMYREVMVMNVSIVVKDAKGNSVVTGSSPRRLTFGGDLGRHSYTPTWSENGSTIYFVNHYPNDAAGPDQTYTSSVLSVPAAGGMVSTVYSVTTPMTDRDEITDVLYDYRANEFAIRNRDVQSSYVGGQWTQVSGSEVLEILEYDASLLAYRPSVTRSWPMRSASRLSWSQSGNFLMWNGQVDGVAGVYATANLAGSTPFLVTTAVRYPAFADTDTKFVGFNSATKVISIVDFSGPTTVTPIGTLGEGVDGYGGLGFSWKRSQP